MVLLLLTLLAAQEPEAPPQQTPPGPRHSHDSAVQFSLANACRVVKTARDGWTRLHAHLRIDRGTNMDRTYSYEGDLYVVQAPEAEQPANPRERIPPRLAWTLDLEGERVERLWQNGDRVVQTADLEGWYYEYDTSRYDQWQPCCFLYHLPDAGLETPATVEVIAIAGEIVGGGGVNPGMERDSPNPGPNDPQPEEPPEPFTPPDQQGPRARPFERTFLVLEPHNALGRRRMRRVEAQYDAATGIPVDTHIFYEDGQYEHLWVEDIRTDDEFPDSVLDPNLTGLQPY